MNVNFKMGNKLCDHYDFKKSWENVRSVALLFSIKRSR